MTAEAFRLLPLGRPPFSLTCLSTCLLIVSALSAGSWCGCKSTSSSTQVVLDCGTSPLKNTMSRPAGQAAVTAEAQLQLLVKRSFRLHKHSTCSPGTRAPARNASIAAASQTSVKFESTQAASLAHLSRDFDPLINSSSAPAAIPMVRKDRSDKCWLKRPAAKPPVVGRGASALRLTRHRMCPLTLPAVPKARLEPEPAPPAGLGPATAPFTLRTEISLRCSCITE